MKHWPPLQDSCSRGFARETGGTGEEKGDIGEMGGKIGETGGKAGCALATA